MSIEALKANVQEALIPKEARLLREAEVKTRTNIGKTKRNELIRSGLFPAPIKILNERQLPGRTSYWLSSDIDTWLAQQVAAHRSRLAETAKDGLNGWLTQAVQSKEAPNA